MRTSGADALFPEIRKRVLAALLMNPGRSWFASDLARHVHAPKTSLQRELSNLHRAGILVRRAEGKHVYYQADPGCPFYPDLRGVMAKTAGLVDVVRDALRPLSPRIAAAFIYGSIASGGQVSDSDVDLMVVGSVGLSDLALPLRRASRSLGREVNPTALTAEEFASKRADKDGFVAAVLRKPTLFVLGAMDDMEGAAGKEPRREGAGHRAGDRRPARPRRPS